MINAFLHKICSRVRVFPGLAGFLLLVYGCDGPPAPIGHHERAPESQGRRTDESVEAEGTVESFASNPGGDIDRLEIETKTGNSWYHFPPHLARQVMAVAEKNSRISIRYTGRKQKPFADDPASELVYLRSVDSKKELDLHGIPPPPPRPGSVVQIEGRPSFTDSPLNKRFFVLAGKKIALSPRSAETLVPIIRGSKHVIVKGEQRDSSDGFVSSDGMPFVRARQLTIDSVNYIIE